MGKHSKLPVLPTAKTTTSRRSWGRGPNTILVPTISKVGGDASHGSHRAVEVRYGSKLRRLTFITQMISEYHALSFHILRLGRTQPLHIAVDRVYRD